MLTQMQTADETTRNRSIRTSSQNILRGIFNKDKSKKKSSYCYAISFLQLFYRCNSIQNYFEFAKIENSNEKILKNIYNRLFSNQKRKKNKAIYIYDFIYNWNGWLGNQRLPNEQSDSMEFANYLIESLSKNIKEIFLSIFMEKSNENLENPVSSSSFFISLQPEKNSLQYLIDNFVQTISLIYKCPKCLLINVNRNFVQSINKDEIIKKLERLGAEKKGEFEQKRYVYDLRPIENGKWIRLRTNGKVTTLAYKDIISNTIDGTREIEFVVDNFDEANEFLKLLLHILFSFFSFLSLRFF